MALLMERKEAVEKRIFLEKKNKVADEEKLLRGTGLALWLASYDTLLLGVISSWPLWEVYVPLRASPPHNRQVAVMPRARNHHASCPSVPLTSQDTNGVCVKVVCLEVLLLFPLHYLGSLELLH